MRSGCNSKSKSNGDVEGLWVLRQSLSVRSGCDSKLKSNGEVKGCEVEGLWALGLPAISMGAI